MVFFIVTFLFRTLLATHDDKKKPLCRLKTFTINATNENQQVKRKEEEFLSCSFSGPLSFLPSLSLSFSLSHPPIRLCLVMMATPTDCIYFLIELARAHRRLFDAFVGTRGANKSIDMG